jgi:hypothetical protein
MMKMIASHTVKHDGKHHAPGAEFDVKDEADVKRLTLLGAAVRKVRTVAVDDDDSPKTPAQVIAMADAEDVSFKGFKAAAAKLLGDKVPAKKDDIITALKALPVA